MRTQNSQRRHTLLSGLAAGVLALGTPVLARAAEPLGLYAGVAAGQSDVRSNQVSYVFAFPTPNPVSFDEHATGWKVLVGIRPLPIVGAELEYADLGHPSSLTALPPPNLAIRTDSHPKAVSLSGLLYAPLANPLLDLYVKAGISRVRTDLHAIAVCTATATNPGCPPTAPVIVSVPNNGTQNRFAYGAGAQVKVSALGIRLEYERFSVSGGDQDLLSLGLVWTF